MKTPTNRVAFMNELRNNLQDVIIASYHRSWLSKRYLGEFNGKPEYIEYDEDCAPQLIEIDQYGIKDKRIRIELCANDDCLNIYVNNEWKQYIEFDAYKNKSSFTAAVAVRIERIVH